MKTKTVMQTAHEDMSRGTWLRLTRADFRRIREGAEVKVIIKTPLELDTLRAQASKMSDIEGCRFSVHYRRDTGAATVIRREKEEQP